MFYRFLKKEGFWTKCPHGETVDVYLRHDPAIGGISVTVHAEDGKARATLRYNHTSIELTSVDELAKYLLSIRRDAGWRSAMDALHRQVHATQLRRLEL